MFQLTPQATTAVPVHSAWKPAAAGPLPAFQRMPWKPVTLPANPRLGQSEGAVKAVTIGTLFLPTAAAAAVSFVGFRLGSKDSDGWVSMLGYVVGALGALSALMGVLAMLGVAVTPLNFTPTTTETATLPSSTPAPAKI